MQTRIFNSFFFLYGRYLQYDLIHSLEQKTKIGRNVDLLIEFRDFFKLLISSKLKQEEEKKGFKNLETDIKNYIGDKQQECLDIKIDKISGSAFDYSMLLTENFKDLL